MSAAFSAVANALVKDLNNPWIAATLGKPDFSALAFTIDSSKFSMGDSFNALVTFVLSVAAVYFLVVLPVNALIARVKRGVIPPDPTTGKRPECLSDIPITAWRCAVCASVIAK